MLEELIGGRKEHAMPDMQTSPQIMTNVVPRRSSSGTLDDATADVTTAESGASNDVPTAAPSVTSGNFTFTHTGIEGVILVEVKQYADKRGYFMETYKRTDFEAGGILANFVQDNQSSSTKGVLRGLHFQIAHPQAKLVRVVRGRVFDVAVDLRRNSATFGKWVGVVLSEENQRQFFIPRGFAHGFLVLSDAAEFCYKCDDVYHPGDEGGLMWNDPDIAISWPALDGDASFDEQKAILSKKDTKHPSLAELIAQQDAK